MYPIVYVYHLAIIFYTWIIIIKRFSSILEILVYSFNNPFLHETGINCFNFSTLQASGYQLTSSEYTICLAYLSTYSDKFLSNKHISTLRNRDSKYRFINSSRSNPQKIMFTTNLNNSFIYDEYNYSFTFIKRI